jgi:phage anti-repressor protein
MAEEFIPVLSANIDGQEVNAVSARELCKSLGVETRFDTWFNRRIEEYGFQQNKDFCSILSESSGGRKPTDYIISLDMAKELSMVEKTEQGRATRQYFIRVEKDHKRMAAALAEGKTRGLIEAHEADIQRVKADRGALIDTLCAWQERAHVAESQSARLLKQVDPVYEFGDLTPDGRMKTGFRKSTYVAQQKLAEIAAIQKLNADNKRREAEMIQLYFNWERKEANTTTSLQRSEA